MKNNNLSLRKLQVYEKNPFTTFIIQENALDVKIKKTLVGKSKDIISIQNETGEVLETSFFKIEQYDSENFTKVYMNFYKSWFGLNNPAIKFLAYIFNILQINRDYIYFDLQDAMFKTEIKSKSTINKAIATLVNCRFIARSRKHYIYFINPILFFNGDRINFVKQIQKKKAKEKKIDENIDTTQGVLFNSEILNENEIPSNSESR